MDLRERRKTILALAGEESLSADERVLLRCSLARHSEGAGDYEEARELLSPFWPPPTNGKGEGLGSQAPPNSYCGRRWTAG